MTEPVRYSLDDGEDLLGARAQKRGDELAPLRDAHRVQPYAIYPLPFRTQSLPVFRPPFIIEFGFPLSTPPARLSLRPLAEVGGQDRPDGSGHTTRQVRESVTPGVRWIFVMTVSPSEAMSPDSVMQMMS